MVVNEVIFGNTTLISLKNDTVTAADVKAGKTLHLASGESATGSLASAYVSGNKLVLPNSTVSGNAVVIGE